MADKGIVERLRDWPREMPLTSSVACDAADHIEKADKLMLLAHRNIEALEASREMSSETITELRAEIARLTEGAIDVMIRDDELKDLRDPSNGSAIVTVRDDEKDGKMTGPEPDGHGSTYLPARLIIDTQGDDE